VTAGDGAPHVSLVMAALDAAARPLLLISDLAEHTKHLAADPRAALLFDGTAGLSTPLAGPRVTMRGTMARIDDAAAKSRYLRRHPDAAAFAGFGDFGLWRMEVACAHMVAGFGAIGWIEPDALLPPSLVAPALAEAEAEICDHMNDTHVDAVQLYARKLLGLPGEGWRMTGIDPEGLDLRLGGTVARLAFDAPVRDASDARAALAALAARARKPGPANDWAAVRRGCEPPF
jgi:heme iron utilization protein